MARNEETLVDLEEEKQFQFNYRKKITRRFKFIRRGSEREAIVRRRIRQKIKPFDPELYQKLIAGKINEWDIQNDFWYSPEDERTILPYLPGLSTFTDENKMPATLKEKPEQLWQLDSESPFPDEVDIIVPEDRPFKGYIRPKSDLNTPVTKDNVIEVNEMSFIH
ncbi:uncharacterized protein LOC111340663 [Stylophora pistillata]|uniref:uncharacterized protein LOC111340663 n=1 Tax=Stylophora pistillata TaxID=50429 RepID=UPI000C0559BD|nr:uncharacterized protein LOC111340663 [Stylophora pistillata]